MKVLALDTALSGCSAAFYDGNACVSAKEAMLRGQSEALVPMVQGVLERAGAGFEDVELIVTTVGPGAFTGLRIGIATALGFGTALGKKVVGVSTLDILAAMFFEKNKLGEGQLLGVLIETKREDYYCRFYNQDGSAEGEAAALPGEKVRDMIKGRDVLFIGDAVSRFAQKGDKVTEGFELPDPCAVALYGLAQFKAGKALPPEPIYLRGADVSTSNKEQREILDSEF